MTVSAIAIKPNALNVESARHQSQVPTLMGLITVEAATGSPFAVGILAFLGQEDADVRIAWCVSIERDDQSRAGKDEFVRPSSDHQSARRRVSRSTLVGDIQCVTVQAHLLRHTLFRAFRQKPGHRSLPLTLKDERRQL